MPPLHPAVFLSAADCRSAFPVAVNAPSTAADKRVLVSRDRAHRAPGIDYRLSQRTWLGQTMTPAGLRLGYRVCRIRERSCKSPRPEDHGGSHHLIRVRYRMRLARITKTLGIAALEPQELHRFLQAWSLVAGGPPCSAVWEYGCADLSGPPADRRRWVGALP